MQRSVFFFSYLLCFASKYILCEEQGQRLNSSFNDTYRQIVGGVPTIPGRYPYQVGLTFGDDSIYCGATLIEPEWVLTAAHCYGFSHVLIGRYDITDPLENFEEIEIAFELTHPNYDESIFDNDLMLIRLKHASSYETIDLNDGSVNLAEGTDVTALGWGAISSGGRSSDILMEVELDLVDYSTCNDAYSGDINNMSMVCASRQDKDACQGDSGGPLLIKGDNKTSDVQIGVISWGLGCALPTFPGVYALVHTGIDFIESTTSCKFPDDLNALIFQGCCNVICQDGFFSCTKWARFSTGGMLQFIDNVFGF